MLRTMLGAGALVCAAAVCAAAPPAQPPAAVPAPAASEVRIGGAPAWVVPVPLTAKESAGGTVLRLLDMQTRVDGEGTHVFSRSIVKFNTAASLQQATNLQVRWQPEMGGVTVNAARILRGGEVIDLLAAGGKFLAIRQEAGLEMGRLDGALTAFMPVTDLRVGDAIEFAFTTDRRNPALAGHTEVEDFLAPGMHFDQISVRYSWPRQARMQARFGSALPAARSADAEGYAVRVLAAQDLTIPVIPKGSPQRVIDRSIMQLSDFADWNDVSRVMRPLFEQGATLAADSPVRQEIARIAAASSDPLARASAALALVQRDVRYFADLQGLGGYVPMSADEVWQRRIGDCKGKSVLLLALLRGLGIEAVPALVSSTRGNGLDGSLAMPGRFDHVIVRARIAGQDYWLDGTRMDTARVGDLELPEFEWALPLAASSAKLVAIAAGEFKRPQTEWRLDLDATAGLDTPAKAVGTGVFRGEAAQVLSQTLQMLDPAKQDEYLRNIWKARHDWVEIDKVSHEIDREDGEVRIGFTGTGKMDWSRSGPDAAFRYEANKARLGTDLIPDREAKLDKDALLLVDRRYDVVHQTILLPDGGKGYFVDGENLDETIGGIHYTRVARLTGNRFDMTATTRSLRFEVAAAAARTADATSDDLFAKRLFVHLPVAASAAAAPPTAGADYAEVAALVTGGHLVEARQLLESRLASTPRDARLLAMRGIIETQQGDLAAADHDLDAALAIDGKLPAALSGKALLLAGRGRASDALILLDRAILLTPEDDKFYRMRAGVRTMARDYEGALSDYGILTGKNSADGQARNGQVRVLTMLGRKDEAIAAARAYRAAAPDDPASLNLLANALLAANQRGEAVRLIDAAQKIAPTADAYILRLRYGLSGGSDGQLADMLAAVRLDPTRSLPDRALAAVASDRARAARLLAAYDAALAKPDANRQAISYARSAVALAAGDPAPLLALLAESEKRDPDNAAVRNNACWLRATHKLDLAAARASCEAAIKLRHAPAFVDSLGMVELQSGNFKASIAAYDEAVQAMPGSAASLFGRGIAKLRSGDRAGGDADIASARQLDPEIDGEFAGYGLKP